MARDSQMKLPEIAGVPWPQLLPGKRTPAREGALDPGVTKETESPEKMPQTTPRRSKDAASSASRSSRPARGPRKTNGGRARSAIQALPEETELFPEDDLEAAPAEVKAFAPEEDLDDAGGAGPEAPAAAELSGAAQTGDQRSGGNRARRSAEAMAKAQREISVSEFFVKNRHLLGFDSPSRALLTTVKEAVDNALDACEDGGILPTLLVELEETGEERFRVAVQDNGPGILVGQVPKVFGKLLYGSKFHTMKQSRGQQGIGISAAGMYGQLTTGRPVIITSRTKPTYTAHYLEVIINTKKNAPEILKDSEVEWTEPHGTRVEIELKGSYKTGKRSVDEYLEQTALANPHAEIFYYPPKGRKEVVYPRLTEELPPEPTTIKPHPYGVELGILMKMLKETSAKHVRAALVEDFSRVTPKVADEICAVAGVSPRARPNAIANHDAEALFNAIQKVKIRAPSTDCVVPIGEPLIRASLEREIRDASFYSVRTRPPTVYRGNPFQVEVGLAYGGQLTGLIDHGDLSDGAAWVGGVRLNPTKRAEMALTAIPGVTRKKAVELLLKAGVERSAKVGMMKETQLQLIRDALDAEVRSDAQSRPIHLVRLANRVPLQYQQSACAIHKAVSDVNWRRYGVNQPRGGLPQGPMVLLVHIASVWVPFTSESKEALAHYPEIIDEIKKGLMDCARELGNYLSRRQRNRAQSERRSKFDLYCGELVEALHHLTGRKRTELRTVLDSAADNYADTGEET
ncbi:MAG: DNA topoisomerase VI subunit B [Polyangia bacterium]|jgi:DNA topoisomerase-6 subunit B|nr:DNA topoisomerase VI subunit B [Polyangia bacterium]